MIFVTVGTHEQPFNRLIKKIDELVKNGDIKEKVVVQTGFSTYKPSACESYKMLSFLEMKKYIQEAHIIITHGGPSSFIEALQIGKIPIVVPRQEKYNEHVNNHQVEFTRLITKRMNNIIPVYDINDLKKVINEYNTLIKNKKTDNISNNAKFNKDFEKIVDGLF